MRCFSFLVFVLASLLGSHAIAQGGCEHTKAVEVPASSSLGPARECDAGLDIHIGTAQILGRRHNCPLFAVYTPTHHKAVSTADNTYAFDYGSTAEVLVWLDCTSHSFLFFKLDSTCDVTGTVNTSTLKLMKTKGCVESSVIF
jgi:hypothetical protein